MSRAGWVLLPLLVACQGEYQVHDAPIAPVVSPPGLEDNYGDPPDWGKCPKGYLGSYANLAVNHPDVEPGDDPPRRNNYKTLDWWDEVAFQRADASLDFGSGWWPVDEGLQDDPAYFAVRWQAWMRVLADTDLEVLVGASDDFWFIVDRKEALALPGIKDFEPEVYTVPVSRGQYPIEVRYAHRAGNSALRFRDLRNSDVQICYPDFEAEAE